MVIEGFKNVIIADWNAIISAWRNDKAFIYYGKFISLFTRLRTTLAHETNY